MLFSTCTCWKPTITTTPHIISCTQLTWRCSNSITCKDRSCSSRWLSRQCASIRTGNSYAPSQSLQEGRNFPPCQAYGKNCLASHQPPLYQLFPQVPST